MLKKLILLMLILFLFFNLSWGEKITHTLTFSQKDLSFIKLKGYDIIYLKDGEITDRVGEPQLPLKIVSFSLPAFAKVEKVEVLFFQKEELEGEFIIYPAQPPQTLSFPKKKRKIPFVEPDKKIYTSKEPYPEKILNFVGTGNMGGYKLANILVYPVEYYPFLKKVFLYTKIEFALFYEIPSEKSSLQKTKVIFDNQPLKRMIQKKVLNPEKIEASILEYKAPNVVPPGDYEYVVITSYESGFQPLVDWKTKKGVPAKIVSGSYISFNYEGNNQQEKIRNFIIDAQVNWGTKWVLLGGDVNTLRARAAYAMTSGGGIPGEDDIPCDLYYSDLDGSWDLNENLVYGEVADSVDMYPDVFVGRISARSDAQAEDVVNKILSYEKNPPLDYQLNALFFAEVMWGNPYTDGGVAKDYIDNYFVPPRFDPITKLYQSLGNESAEAVLAAMNQGQNLMNHNGHAWIEVLSVGWDYITNWDMDALSNSPRNGILFSIGCWPGAYDYDCFGEHFVNNPNGGGIAFIGNSRYGWGSPGNPEYGYSDRFDQQFFKALFEDDIYNLGATLASAKATYVSRAGQENVYRWCEYEITLFGDPEMPVWTDTPHNLEVFHPDTIPAGQSVFAITVTENSNPLDGALVCVMKNEEVYQRGRTDSKGQINFLVEPTSPGTLFVTVTAHNFLPYEGGAQVISEGPYIAYQNLSIDDSEGNSDGKPNPGETLSLIFTLKNFGLNTAYNVTAHLRTENSLVTLIDTFQSFGTIEPQGEALSLSQYSFSLSDNFSNGEVVYFALDVEADYGNFWSNNIAIEVATPILAFETYTVDDREGNNNGVPDPDEIFNLMLTLKNKGLGEAKNVVASISTSDPSLNLIDTIANFGNISGGLLSTQVYRVEWTPTLSFSAKPTTKPVNPDGFSDKFLHQLATLNLNIQAEEEYAFTDSFILSLGIPYFEDDFEDGVGGWTHSGTNDLWHISTHRPYSSSHSWYCGEEGTWQYQNNMDCSLVSPYFVLAPNSYLSFWRWFDVATYGVNGFYVEIDCGSGWEVLDFIGSGGALDSALMGDVWHIEAYDLSSYPSGTSVRIRFRFVSDNEPVEEGVYIDDVKIGPILIAGDVNSDNLVDVSDVIFLANYLLKGGPSPNPLFLGDVNCDGKINLADVIYLANYLIKGGPAPCTP